MAYYNLSINFTRVLSRSTTIASSDTIPPEVLHDIQLRCLCTWLPEEIHSQRKYRRIMFDIKPLSFTRFILISSCLSSSWVPWNCFCISGNSSKMDNSNISNSTIFIYLFIFRSFDNRRRWIHKIREYSRGKLLSLMLMFYAWQFDDTWRVSIIWARVSTYGGSSKRRGTLDGNIFRQHHRGIVRMKFSRSGSTRLHIPR